MNSYEEQKELLLEEIAKLHSRHKLALEVGPDYFEPGMMEYSEQFDGKWDETTGVATLRFESRGTRYNGRTELIEMVHVGDVIQITRDQENEYNQNNFLLLTEKGKDVGNMPAELCNVVAPLYDEGCLMIEGATVSFVEPISRRSRYAKQAVLFVEMHARLNRVAIVEETNMNESISEKEGTTYNGDDPYGFISYSHKDSKPVSEIIFQMQKKGFRIWYDTNIEAGSNWDDNIAEHVEKCEYFFAMVSKNYLLSENCIDELVFAKDENKRILLIYLEDVKLSGGIRMRFNRIQAIMKWEMDDMSFYEKLFSAREIRTIKV